MSDTRLWTYHQDTNRNFLQEWYARQELLRKIVEKTIPKNGTILEIWFGDGYLLQRLSKLWYSVFGQDLSIENIEITKKDPASEKITFLLWDETGTLKIDDNSLNGFVASEVLEHMNNEELTHAIGEILRVLKPWATAIITVPYKENLDASTHYCPHCGNTFHTWWHKQSWNEERIQEVFTWFKNTSIQRFMSLGQSHYKNPLIRIAAKVLDASFFINRDMFGFISSNYLIVLKK